MVEALPDVRFTTIDRLWSGHNLILLYITKWNFGPTLFKLFHSWSLRDTFDEFIKIELSYLEEQSFGMKLISHEKFRFLKARIKQWHIKIKNSDSTIKQDNLQAIKSNEGKIEAESANDIDRDTCDENSKFLYGLLKQKRRAQMIQGITKDGVWILDPSQIKEVFLNFFKDMFKDYDSNVDFLPFGNSYGLCSLDRESLEIPISLE
ncbi:hypothetical protein Tco_0033994 [Tanacetum coccineum]